MQVTETLETVPICHICRSRNVQFFCEKNGCKLYDCRECTLTFVYPIPNNLGAIYAENYFKNEGKKEGGGYTNYDKDKAPMRPVFELYLEKLRQPTSGRRIFDVGSATGYFLDIAKQKGWETFGSEISEYAAGEARSRGHKMVCGDLTHMDDLPEIDAVTLWDVLEHVDRPRAYLEALHRMLTSDGMLAINTVDRSSVWARMLGLRWHLIVPPEHLYYYAPKNLRLLLEQTGFEVLEIKKIGKTFSLSYIFKMLGSWQKLEIWNLLARATDTPMFRRVGIPINLRDNIFVLARKVKIPPLSVP